MDKIEKIRKEIERMLELLPTYDGSQMSLDYSRNCLVSLLKLIDTLQDEPVSKDLEEIIDGYTRTVLERTNCLIGNQSVGEEISKAVKFGANWQEAKDQETIEVAEDHAMLAGMEKMKEQMMSVAVEGRLYSTICGLEQNIVVPDGYGEYGKDGEMIGLFEFYLRNWCEENGKDTIVITNSDGKKIFEATLLDKE